MLSGRSLSLHPGYLSALRHPGPRPGRDGRSRRRPGRASEHVLKSAPENRRRHPRPRGNTPSRQGRLKSATHQYRAALLLARNDPDISPADGRRAQLSARTASRAAQPDEGLSLDQVQDEFLQSLPSRTRPRPPLNSGTTPRPNLTDEATTVAGLGLEPKAGGKSQEPEPANARGGGKRQSQRRSLRQASSQLLPSEPMPSFVTPPRAGPSIADVAEALEGAARARATKQAEAEARRAEAEADAEPGSDASLATVTESRLFLGEAAPAAKSLCLSRSSASKSRQAAGRPSPIASDCGSQSARRSLQPLSRMQHSGSRRRRPHGRFLRSSASASRRSRKITAERAIAALRTIAALGERWIAAIHVARAQPARLACRQQSRTAGSWRRAARRARRHVAAEHPHT